MSMESDFYQRVYALVQRIPPGRVTTYGHIAAALGLRSSARMVGWALNAIPLHRRLEIPAHRVVNRMGELSGRMHFETPFVMRERLEAENVTFNGDSVNIGLHLWIPDTISEES